MSSNTSLTVTPREAASIVHVIAAFVALAVLTLAVVFVAAAGQASAQSAGVSGPVRTVSTSQPVRIAVIGDSLAFEVFKGLHRVLDKQSAVELLKYSKVSTGLIRRDVYDWNKRIDEIVREDKFDVAVVVLGGNDRQSVWVGSTRLQRGTDPWFAEYAKRTEAFMKSLQISGKRVYWVGLPVVRSSVMTRDYSKLNEIFQKLAKAHGFEYVDTWGTFANKAGKYTAFGRDQDGARRRMRSDDGIHFSRRGQRKLGEVVYRQLSEDIEPLPSINLGDKQTDATDS